MVIHTTSLQTVAIKIQNNIVKKMADKEYSHLPIEDKYKILL